MAVIVSNGTGNLSDSNRFTRSDAYNLGLDFNNTTNLLTTARSATITFANSGKCKGVLIPIYSIYTTTTNKSNRTVRLDLEETRGAATMAVASPGVVTCNSHGLTDGMVVRFSTTGALLTGIVANTIYYVRNATTNTFNISTTPSGSLSNFSGTQSGTHTLWASRDNKILSASDMNPEINDANYHNNYGDVWCGWVNFEFASGGYTINTTASAWRITVFIDSGSYGNYYWMTSDAAVGTALSYVTYSDNAVTASSGNDAIYFKDVINIDQSFTLKGYLATTDTVNAWCGGVTRGAGLLKTNVANLVCDSPASSYTLTVDGLFVLSSYGGIRIGSEATPIPFAQQFILNFAVPTVGTSVVSSIWAPYRNTSTYFRNKTSVLFYGAVPTKTYGRLASDAAIGANSLSMTEDLSSYWSNTNNIFVGKQYIQGTLQTGYQVISSISGATINLTGTIPTTIRKAGGLVINRDAGYGIKITRPNASNYCTFAIGIPMHLVMQGCVGYQVSLNIGGPTSGSYFGNASLLTNTTKWTIQDCYFWTESTSYYIIVQSNFAVGQKGFIMQRCILHRASPMYGVYAYNTITWKTGTIEFKNNKIVSFYNAGINQTVGAGVILDIQGNEYQNNTAGQPAVFFGGKGSILKNNIFYGWSTAATTYGVIQFVNGINCYAEGNTYDYCLGVYTIGFGTNINFEVNNDSLGVEAANTTDLYYLIGGSYTDISFKNCSGINTIDTTYQTELGSGSMVRFVNFNDVANDDKVTTPNGLFQRTGTGLSDTTVLSTNNYSLRFQPNNSPNLLEWCETVPTGNVQNQTMVVACKVKINNANYYAGSSYQLPRLTVTYDDGTTTYSEATATTNEQTIVVSFTPTTTFGQIEICMSGMTDATSTDAYFYFGDRQVFYPSGHQVNTGNMSLWADALPVTPTIVTPGVPAADIWAYQTSAMNTSGSAGVKLKSDLTLGQFMGLK